TVLFCKKYIPADSRTRDQMVQAARSGVQNIAEGSIDAATSTKLEMNLYNVARASQIELRCDYLDYLRQRELRVLRSDDPALLRFRKRRCSTLSEVRAWVGEERACSVSLRVSPCFRYDELAANAALSLLNLSLFLLKRQIDAKAQRFLREGGFNERLYRMRIKNRDSGNDIQTLLRS
ncbi:MAG: four helix bundle suffix domain-containing protein, partial [Victivallaceae bacterium]